MADSVVTASAVISFAARLEDSSTTFYEALAERFAEEEEMFLAFARDSQKNKTLVVRTYRETISDALEAGFSFQGLDLERHEVETVVDDDVGWSEALDRAIEIERRAIDFYLDVAERSRSLLATIPMAFKSVAKRRKRRKRRLLQWLK
ncbi:MAG: hypothetical protein PVF54_00030 [Anaerolineae bacterium]|jgi:rubrerythrin